MAVKITEMIEFAGFNTRENNLYLLSRSAPTPEEKEIIENIPFMQGVLDFSMILGERIFENREIEYEFLLLDSNYSERSRFETTLKHKLMPHGQQRLFDSHDNGFFWVGKCKSVEVEHDHHFNLLKAIIVFDCYPFMFTLSNYFDDVWDSFDFNDGVAGFTKYSVSGQKEILLINTGSQSVEPEVITTAKMTVATSSNEYVYSAGTSTKVGFALQPGINHLTVSGNGTIHFHWRAEVMG